MVLCQADILFYRLLCKRAIEASHVSCVQMHLKSPLQTKAVNLLRSLAVHPTVLIARITAMHSLAYG